MSYLLLFARVLSMLKLSVHCSLCVAIYCCESSVLLYALLHLASKAIGWMVPIEVRPGLFLFVLSICREAGPCLSTFLP